MQQNGKPLRVLVVDPDPYVSRVVEARLSRGGQYRVTTASGAADAIAAATATPFHVILWEWWLPDRSEVLPYIRALCPDAALIITTTDDRVRPDGDLIPLGVASVLEKPFGLDALPREIAKALRQNVGVFARQCLDLCCVGQRVAVLAGGDRFTTRVLQHGMDTFFVVGEPRVHVPASLEPGVRVRVELQGEDGVYSFDAKVLDHETDPVPGWRITLPRVIRRSQRRKHVRYPLSVPVEIAVSQGPAAGRNLRGQLENVSTGGCALVSPESLTEGTGVDLSFEPPLQPLVRRSGKIRRCVVTPPGAGHSSFHIGVQFERRRTSRAQ